MLRRAGLSRLSDLQPSEPVQRYEREAPGDLLHIDIKKLARFEQVGHRITGNRRQNSRGSGWDYLFVAIDDHSRMAFTQIHPDERRESATRFLRGATDYFATLGVSVQRCITHPLEQKENIRDLQVLLGHKNWRRRPYIPTGSLTRPGSASNSR